MQKVLSFLAVCFGLIAMTGTANAVVAAATPITANLAPITEAGTQVALIGGAILLVVLAIKGWQMLKRA